MVKLRSRIAVSAVTLCLLLVQARAGQSENPLFVVTLGAPHWQYFAAGAGVGSTEFAPSKYAVEVPVKITALTPLPEGKTARDYVFNPDRLLHDATGKEVVILTDLSPRGEERTVELLMRRPDRPDPGGTRHETFELSDVPVEIAGAAASSYRRVTKDGSRIEMRAAHRTAQGRYEVVIHLQTPLTPRDAQAYVQLAVSDDTGKSLKSPSVSYLEDKTSDYLFNFPTAPASDARTVKMTINFSSSAASWLAPGAVERHMMSVRVPPLPEEKCVDGSDLVRDALPQLYRGRGGARSIAAATSLEGTNYSRGSLPRELEAYSFLHDPKLDPSTPWRIREIVLRDAANRAIYRDGWPHFWPREYNRQGLPLRREFYGQQWAFWAPRVIADARSLEMRWAPVEEHVVAVRFGPLDLTRATRTQRLGFKRALKNGVLSLRAWQLPPLGASKQWDNRSYPLALWFSYAPQNRAASFFPTDVEWENQSGRLPQPSNSWIAGWNLAKHRPRRAGEADATAWRSQNAPPADYAKRFFVVIRGVERRVVGPDFSSRTPLGFSF